MGVFLSITYDLRWAGSFEANVKQDKVVNYIATNLGDMIWQEEISNQVQRIDKHHISLAIVLRLFRREDIKKNSLKSYARYIQKKDILNIDQMLALDEYIELSENEMRCQLCDAVFILAGWHFDITILKFFAKKRNILRIVFF